jgi:hypothetical protein
MWTEKLLKEKISIKGSFQLSGLLTELLPLALDITEDSKKIPYVFSEPGLEDLADRIHAIEISPSTSPDELTVKNYHAMLRFLDNHFKENPYYIKDQKDKGFFLLIDFEDFGRPNTNSYPISRVYTSVNNVAYDLCLSFRGDGYTAISRRSKTELQQRCEDFMGPNKRPF